MILRGTNCGVGTLSRTGPQPRNWGPIKRQGGEKGEEKDERTKRLEKVRNKCERSRTRGHVCDSQA